MLLIIGKGCIKHNLEHFRYVGIVNNASVGKTLSNQELLTFLLSAVSTVVGTCKIAANHY